MPEPTDEQYIGKGGYGSVVKEFKDGKVRVSKRAFFKLNVISSAGEFQ
jgi:hypothetical protein